MFQPETGTVKTIAPTESTDPSWIEVPHCSAEALLKIAHAFVDTAPEPFRPVLTQTLTEKKWWLPLLEVLRNVGLKTSWFKFRRGRITDEFDRSISHLLAARHEMPTQEPHPTQTGIEDKPVTQASGESLLRRLAVNAIERMSEAELRTLNIPLGYIVDSLGSSNR